MKELGMVRTITHSGHMIVKANFAPRLNTKVLNSRMLVVGEVSRVFGNVRSPYATIRPMEKNMKGLLALVGKALYIGEDRRIEHGRKHKEN